MYMYPVLQCSTQHFHHHDIILLNSIYNTNECDTIVFLQLTMHASVDAAVSSYPHYKCVVYLTALNTFHLAYIGFFYESLC